MQGYKIKKVSTGQLGWIVYATKKEARAAAKALQHLHGKSVVVQANGQPCFARPKFEDGASQMLRTINFTCNVTRFPKH